METAKSSGFLSADSLICDAPCVLTGVQLYSDGTNAATLILYDSQNADGKIVYKAACLTNASNSDHRDWVHPIKCNDGLYADITGTNAGYIVEYID